MVIALPLHGGRHARSEVRHHSTSFLTRASSLQVALLILNVEHNSRPGAIQFSHLWDLAFVRLCADGAANRLYDSLGAHERGLMLPDVISGDLDSVRPEVASFYAGAGVEIDQVTEQETNDFEKCLCWLQRRCNAAATCCSIHSHETPSTVSIQGASLHARALGCRPRGMLSPAGMWLQP